MFVAADCAGAQACGDRGECSAPGVCRCYSGYDGIDNGCRNCKLAVHSVFPGLAFSMIATSRFSVHFLFRFFFSPLKAPLQFGRQFLFN